MSYKYGPSIVTDGLVFYVDAANDNSYPGTGTTWGDLVGGTDGTLTNGSTYDSANGGSIVFAGDDDLITTTLTSNTIFNSTFTVSCWFNADTVSNFPRPFSKSNNASTTDVGGFSVFFNDSSGTYQVYCRINGNLINTSSATFSLSSWNNLTVVFKDGEATVYLNQSSGVTGTNASALLSGITTTDDFIIGNLHAADRPFDGKIATTMIYNRELSSTEITQNYNALKNRFV